MVGDIMQPTHLLFVLVVALLVLGPKRLPEVGRTLGSGIRDFRQALSGEAPERPHTQESEQVPSSTTELRHQPDTVANEDIDWPEEAIGPSSFDEPVEAASPEPTSAAPTESEPVESASAVTASEPAQAAPAEDLAAADGAVPTHIDEPVATHSEPEHQLAPQAADTGGPPEPQTGSRD